MSTFMSETASAPSQVLLPAPFAVTTGCTICEQCRGEAPLRISGTSPCLHCQQLCRWCWLTLQQPAPPGWDYHRCLRPTIMISNDSLHPSLYISDIKAGSWHCWSAKQEDLYAQGVQRNIVHDAASTQIATSSSGSSSHMERISQAVVMTQQTAPFQGLYVRHVLTKPPGELCAHLNLIQGL